MPTSMGHCKPLTGNGTPNLPMLCYTSTVLVPYRNSSKVTVRIKLIRYGIRSEGQNRRIYSYSDSASTTCTLSRSIYLKPQTVLVLYVLVDTEYAATSKFTVQ